MSDEQGITGPPGQGPREGGVRGRDLIASKKTLQEILEVATSFEKTAFDFYTALIPRVSKRIRYLVEELAVEEQAHYDLFKKLATEPGINEQIKSEIATPVNDQRFSNYVQMPDLGAAPDDQAILQYALYRENAAMEQYQDLANHTEPGPIHDLFVFLANEETKHKGELEKAYYELVHSGGV
jgi:rubrerythrin